MRDLLCRLPDGKHIMDNDEFLIFIDFVKSCKTVRDVKAVYYNAAFQQEFFFVPMTSRIRILSETQQRSSDDSSGFIRQVPDCISRFVPDNNRERQSSISERGT